MIICKVCTNEFKNPKRYFIVTYVKKYLSKGDKAEYEKVTHKQFCSKECLLDYAKGLNEGKKKK